ncbi:tetratricopeptide repeat protein [Candidatus Nitrospira bockiana]
MKTVLLISVMIVSLAAFGCASKPKPRVPLPLRSTVPQEIAVINAQAIQAYQQGQLEQAKAQFQQVVAAAPSSAEAHYNLGLTLYATGNAEQAQQHFIEAANLAPGDKVIWDSPALRQYGSPDTNIPKAPKDPNAANQRPGFGGMRRY